MKNPPLNTDEFDRLLNQLAYDIQDAAIYRKLDSDISVSIAEFWREFAQSQTFWSLSRHAYGEIALQRISRIYVGHHDALSLESWLNAIKENPQLFASQPNLEQFEHDLDFVTRDPLVKRLIALRGNVVAHTNWNNVSQSLRLGSRFALTLGELDLLIVRAMEILNRYSVLFKRVHWITVMTGQDDFQKILAAVRDDLGRRWAQVDQDIMRACRAERVSRCRYRFAAIRLGRFLGRLQRQFKGNMA